MPSSKELSPITTPFFPKLFIKNQFRTKPQHPPKNTDLSEKVAIVTGGNIGLGFESARQLLSFKLSHLILAVRSPKKGTEAARKLNASYPKATIDVWELDMASYDSIQAFTKRAETQLSRLDIVILNAGVFKFNPIVHPPASYSKEKIPAGTPGRLTISNAALTLNAKFPNRNQTPLFPSFDDPKSFDMSEWYNTSKLLAHMFLWKLTDCVSAEDVVVNLADPGAVAGTQLARDVPGVLVLAGKFFSAVFARSLPDGASTYLDACVVKGKESHGCFIMGWQIKPFAAMLYTAEGKEVIEKVWRETMDELSFANVLGVLGSMKTH